jgi:hypothetical protein
MEGGDKRTISAEQVAILADRVDTLINNYSRIEGLIMASAAQQQATAQQVAVFQERLAQLGESLRRTNDTSDQTEERLEDGLRRVEVLQQSVTVHAWAWKLFGTVAVLSLGLVTWTFKQLQDNSRDLLRHELIIQQLQQRPFPNPYPAPQQRSQDESRPTHRPRLVA